MLSHKSQARRRRLAHASGLFRRYRIDQRTPNALLRETHQAMNRAGWSYRTARWPDKWLASRGHPCT